MTAYINTGLVSDPAKAVDQDLVPGDLVLWVLLTAHDYNANNSKHDRGFAIQCYVRACSRPTNKLECVFNSRRRGHLAASPAIDLTSRYSSKPNRPHSRPLPDCL